MSNLREAYAATAFAGLQWSDVTERAVDRVAASGKCDSFALKLWKARYQLETTAFIAAQQELLKIYQKRYRDNETVGSAMVAQAMREYLNPACRACQGRGEMLVNSRLLVCDICQGSKIHRHTDEERARTMQISYGLTKRCAHKLRWLNEFMNGLDRQVNAIMSDELERT